MAVAFRAVSTATTGAGTSVTANVPAGVVNGDLLLLILGLGLDTAAPTTPTGWTLERSRDDATNGQGFRVYKRIAASEPSSYTVTLGVSSDWAATIVAYSGTTAIGSAVHAAADALNGNTTAQASPSVTPTVNDCMIVAIFSADSTANHTPVTPDASPAATERLEYGTGTGDLNLYVEEFLQGTAAAVSLDATFTTAPAAGMIAATLALRPYVAPSSPMTVTIAASGDDGYVERWGTASGGTDGSADSDIASTAFLTRNSFPNFGGTSSYVRGNAILRFDTSEIPDGATITAATLDIKTSSPVSSVDALSFSWEWIADPGTITAATDWSATPSGTAKAAALISGIAADTAYSWTLLNPNANISKTAFTGLRAHVSNGTPTGANIVQFHSWDHATEPEPRLVITYTTAAVQYGRPDGTVTAGSYVATGAASLWEALDEATAGGTGDDDYAEGPDATATPAAFTVSLTNVTDPASSINHLVRYRIGKNTSGGDSLQIDIRLKQGATLIASWARTVPDAPTTYTETLTAAQADSITDYTALNLEFEEKKV